MLGESARDLRIVKASSAAGTGKKQQRFGKLVKEVARLKAAVRAWGQAEAELGRGVAECMRLSAEHRAALAELVRVLDRGYPHRALTRREQAYLRDLLCDTARELLHADGPESLDDVKAIYNRHSRGDFDAEAAQDDAIKARMMKSVLAGFGFDFAGADIRSVSDLEEAACAQADEMDRAAERRERERQEQAARRKKSARQVAAEVRGEAERAQVGKALQEVYRKLAIALHPDREPDPEERARKTVLMQQINVAYEEKDLLQLLELQLRFEQIDEAQISTLAEDRLERYNRLLAEQVSQLKQELADVEAPWRSQLDLPRSGRLSPARIRAALAHDQRTLADDIVQTRRDVQALADERALKAWLRAALAAERDLRRSGDLFGRD